MRPVATITAFDLFCIGSGYLWVEGCIGVAKKMGSVRIPLPARIATDFAPLIVLGVVVWMIWALRSEHLSETRPRSQAPIATGIASCCFLFGYYIYAGLSVFTLHDGPLSGS